MAIYRWVLQLSNRNCRVFVRHLVFLPNFVTLPFELTRTNFSAQISALEGDWIKMKMIISFSLSLHYPLRCGGASLSWSHCCTWKIRYNQGLIRFGLWIWVTWLQVEYPTIWGLNPTMKILNFFFSLISLYNNRNQWQLQRSIFEKNHTFYWTPGAAYYLFSDTTIFIYYSKCFFALCTKYGNQPTITSFKDQHQYSISWSFIQKNNWIICFHRLLNHQCIAKLITGVELKEGPSVSMTSL